jgi:hypothetical protein
VHLDYCTSRRIETLHTAGRLDKTDHCKKNSSLQYFYFALIVLPLKKSWPCKPPHMQFFNQTFEKYLKKCIINKRQTNVYQRPIDGMVIARHSLEFIPVVPPVIKRPNLFWRT